MSAIPLQREIEYPESDGQPMAETDVHRDEMVDLIRALRRRYQDEPDVYVTGNIFLYYQEGNPWAVVAPDVFLVKGAPKRQRTIYKLWEEGRAPSLVIELTSEHTRDEDLSKKKSCYRILGVEEYFLHDPCGDYLEPPLQGWRLVGGLYQPIRPEPDGSLPSLTTGLLLRREGQGLRLVDAVTGKPLLWSQEVELALERAEERAEQETALRRSLEEELNRLRLQMEGKVL